MNRTTLTVLFEEPYWVAIVEREEAGMLTVARQVFGAEPTAPEIYDWLLTRHLRFLRFSSPVAGGNRNAGKNPKRLQREAKRAMEGTGVGTKSRDAMRLMLEARKTERKVKSKAEREAEEERKYRMKREQAKARHRGR